MKNFKNQKGFTLIELILYMAIISIVMGGLIPFAWNVIGGSAKSSVEQEIASQARYVSERIKYEIRNASGITSVTATSISLTNFAPDTTTVINLSGNKMTIGENGATAINLNSNDTNITCTTCFTSLTSGDSKTKHIWITFTVDDAGTSTRQEYQSPAINIETSAEIRSN